MGISRQAVAALARSLTSLGITDTIDDPHDRRAQLVRLTERGADLCDRAIEHLAAREELWRRRFGGEALTIVRTVLTDLADPDLSR